MSALSEAEPLNQLERLVVIFAVAPILVYLLLGVLGPMPYGTVDAGNVAATEAQIKQFDTGLTAYEMKFGEVPDQLERLWKPPYGAPIMTGPDVPLDPWDNSYRYLRTGRVTYLIVSLGADGVGGGDGADADIRSDEIANEADK